MPTRGPDDSLFYSIVFLKLACDANVAERAEPLREGVIGAKCPDVALDITARVTCSAVVLLRQFYHYIGTCTADSMLVRSNVVQYDVEACRHPVPI